MDVRGKKQSERSKQPAESTGNSPAAMSTGEQNGTWGKKPRVEKANAPRTALLATGPVTNRPLRTRVIEFLGIDFMIRRDAKKKAPYEADRQVKAVLQAVKDGNSSAAQFAMSNLKNALVPLVSKKANAPNHEQLIASFMGDHVPKKLPELQTLREGLHQLASRSANNAELEQLLFVVEVNMLKLQTELFQSGPIKNVDSSFFHPDSHTELHQLNVTQLQVLSDMNKVVEAVAQRAGSLSRDNQIPGTKLTVSEAAFIAVRTGGAKLRLEQRALLLSPKLDELNMKQLNTLKAATTAWLKKTTADSARDDEMYARNADTVNAIFDLEEAELQAKLQAQLQAKARAALLAKELVGSSASELKNLLSETKGWIDGGAKLAPIDLEMQAMYQRTLTRLDGLYVAEARAASMASLVSVNIDKMDMEEVKAVRDQMNTLSRLVPMDKSQIAELSAQQMNVIDRITVLEDEINRKQRNL